MDALWNLRKPTKSILVGGIIFIAPLVLNLFLWGSFAAPQQGRLRKSVEIERMAEAKPKLEALLRQSQQRLKSWRQSAFSKEDPAQAMQVIQKIGMKHHVQIQEIRSRGQQSSSDLSSAEAKRAIPGFSEMSVELEVKGSFGKLLRWLSDIENQSGLEIESWEIIPAKYPDEPHRLAVDLTVLLQ